jgi:hypothetical protein
LKKDSLVINSPSNPHNWREYFTSQTFSIPKELTKTWQILDATHYSPQVLVGRPFVYVRNTKLRISELSDIANINGFSSITINGIVLSLSDINEIKNK